MSTNEPPPLPDFLNRKLWTAEQWSNAQKAYSHALEAQARERAAMEKRAQGAKKAKEAKDASDALRRQERLAAKALWEQKRILQASVLQQVRLEFDKGPVTVHGLRQVAAGDKKGLVPWALRTMLRTGEAKRASRKVYRRNK